MIKISAQIRGKALFPFSLEDEMALKNYRQNQVVVCKIKGTTRLRSLQQHKWAMWMIRFVSESDDDPKWNTFDGAKKEIKMTMQFFAGKPIVNLETGLVWFEFRSFAFDKMPQAEADRVYNEVKFICAQRLGCEPEELEKNAKREA